nr:MAG TPA: Large Terminase [Caudoviricetes sp.]
MNGREQKGSTEPRVYTPPLRPVWPRSEETEANTAGYEVVEFANLVLGLELYPWQEWLLAHALELRPDGTFRYRTVVVLVARQNGKSLLAKIVMLWSLYVRNLPLIIGTAQDLETAETLWGEVVEMAQDDPHLVKYIRRVNRRNGARSLEVEVPQHDRGITRHSEYKVKASTRKAARGLSADMLFLDELREHTNWDAWGAITKTTMARPRAQVWTLSNAGDELSVVLMSLRKSAHKLLGDPDGINRTDVPDIDGAEEPEATAGTDTLGLFEWSAAPGRGIWDRDGWREANPSLGYGDITYEALESSAAIDPEAVFRTECLCQWVLGTIEGPFPDGSWDKCTDLAGEIADPSDVSYAVDVSVDRSTAWIAVGGLQASGRPQAEIAAGRPGGGWMEWVPEWFERIADPAKPVRVVVASRGMNPVSALVEPLRRIPGIEVIEWAGPDMPAACGLLYDRVVAVLEDQPALPPFAHRGQEALNLAAATAAQRVTGDGWYWDRRNSAQDASPLVAVTGAVWDVLRYREEVAPSIYSYGVPTLV